MASTDDTFPAAEAALAGESASTTTPAGAGQGEETPAPARKRASRRATKKAAAPAPAASAAPPAESAAAAETDAGPEAPAEGEAPAKKAAKRTAKKATAKKTTAKRAAKKTADSDEGPAAESETQADARADAQADTGAADEGAEGSARPARKTTRASRSRASKAAATTTQDGDAAPVADVDAEVDAEVDADTDATESAESTAAAPAFGVLFQAPDPAKAQPRRAAKKAGPPAPAPAAEPEAATQDAEQDQGSDAAETSDDSESGEGSRRRRRRGGKGRRGRGGADNDATDSARPEDESDDTAMAQGEGDRADDSAEDDSEGGGPRRRTRRRRRSGSTGDSDDPPGTVTRVREARKDRDEPTSLKGSTRLEAKKQRRREGREAGRRRTIITEAEFLARRESVERVMVVRNKDDRTQIGVLEDGVLVEHYVSRETNVSMAGNVYLGRVQNVLPSMEAAFIDIGKGRNAVLYAGEVNWDAAGLENNQPRRIENALKSGDPVLVQVTKDPIGHKGARLTSQVSLPGRYLVYVPEGNMTGISRKLPDTERARLKAILKEVVPDKAGVIVRTAAEGASEEELRADVERLTRTWEKIQAKAEGKSGTKAKSGGAPMLVHGEPDLTVRVIRDVFNEDFTQLVVAGEQAWGEVSEYIGDVAPDLAGRLSKWTSEEDLFTHYRVDEQIAKAMDRKVWLPSGGSLVIDRTEAMTVVDVNTGKFVGSGGNLEETVTKNNIEAAEEIVRQLRLRDIGGIIVIDFIDMVLESNRDLVVRRLLECLGRDRTKHQVAEVTSLGLVQMTRKRVGSGLIEVFSENCEHCNGRGIIVHADPVDKPSGGESGAGNGGSSGGPGSRPKGRRGRGSGSGGGGGRDQADEQPPVSHGPTPAQIAAAAHAAALKTGNGPIEADEDRVPAQDAPALAVVGSEPNGEGLPAAKEPAAQEPAAQEPAAQAEAPAPQAEPQPEPVQEQTQPPAQEGTQSPAQVPAAPAEAPAPRRRKRGRVVAPAGPPRSASSDAARASSEPAPADAS